MKFNFALLSAFLVVQVELSPGCHGVSYNCNEGCDLDPAVNGASVCGVDGITYFNECFAFCQVKSFNL
jgi:Kazal-type serine protease inhibitor domain